MAGKGKGSSKIECLLVCQTLHSCPPAQVQQSPHRVVLDEPAGGFCLSHKHILISALKLFHGVILGSHFRVTNRGEMICKHKA